MKTNSPLPKLTFCALLALAGLTVPSHGQSYLVDLFYSTGYNGNAATDFGITGSVTDVYKNGTGTLNTSGATYTLGAATLTLNALPSASGTSSNGIDSSLRGTAEYLTGNGIYTEPSANGPVTFTLSGLTVGDTVTISALASYSPNNGPAGNVSIFDGSTLLGTGTAPLTVGDTETGSGNIADGTGTFGLDGTFVATADTYTIKFNATTMGEGELGSFLITETSSAVPEPSTWAMMFGGLAVLGLVLRSRRGARQA